MKKISSESELFRLSIKIWRKTLSHFNFLTERGRIREKGRERESRDVYFGHVLNFLFYLYPTLDTFFPRKINSICVLFDLKLKQETFQWQVFLFNQKDTYIADGKISNVMFYLRKKIEWMYSFERQWGRGVNSSEGKRGGGVLWEWWGRKEKKKTFTLDRNGKTWFCFETGFFHLLHLYYLYGIIFLRNLYLKGTPKQKPLVNNGHNCGVPRVAVVDSWSLFSGTFMI